MGRSGAFWETAAMLNLYQSNMLEALARLYLAVREPSRDPLVPETLLVPSQGMQRWLAFELARQQGIAANLDFQLPSSFMWQLIRRAFPELPLRSPLDCEPLAWRVMRELPQLAQSASLQRHWAAADSRGRFELAARVADVFDQYLVYRPDWILAWEQGRLLGLGPDEEWQAALWRAMAGRGTPHRARLLREFAERLGAGAVRGLPERLTLFGVSSLPPAIWDLLKLLGERHEVDVFLLNPSREFWGQLRRGDGEDSGHPLLAALGQQGRDFIATVVASGAHEPVGGQAFVQPAEESLLGALQADLLQQRLRAPGERVVLREDDRSVQVHACHNALREMEVLHDQLLMLFREDPSLQPDEVLVMCSDIERYAPLADAVFGTRADPAAIPYTIADRRLEAEEPLLRYFESLLALPGSRFEAERVLALLEEPALRARFELEVADLPLLRRWCEELHLRWGRDGADRRARGLPEDAPLTWRDGLARLLAGFALPGALAPTADRRFAGRVPADLVLSVSHAQVMARLVAFVETLLHWEQRLSAPRTLSAWADTLDALVEAFFSETADSRDALACLHACTAELREQAALAEDAAVHDFGVVTTWLRRSLKGLESRHGFLSGAVTICAMVPLRSLPFKVIAVLGLDDGVFPRQQKAAPFDLVARHGRPGDRSRRLDDRYLFLETLMAARQTLYLSYVGASDVDGSRRAPSPLLAELLDQVGRTVAPDSASLRRLVVRHALQPFSPRYFQGEERLFSFERRLADASRVVATRDAAAAVVSGAIFVGELPPPEAGLLDLTLPRLERFLRHPARYFLRERLGVQLPEDSAALADDEPVALADRRALRRRLFDAPGLPAAALRAEGLLPAGVWGDRLWEVEAVQVQRLRERRAELGEVPLPPLDFALLRGDITFSGQFTELGAGGLVRVSLENTIYPTDVLQLWLSHLLLGVLKPEGVAWRSQLLGLRDHVVLEPVADPGAALDNLLDAYRDGLRRPLPLFRRASPAYVKKSDLGAARRAYEGNPPYTKGDASDAWIRLLWRDADPCDERFAEWAARLYGPIAEKLP
jgi:exodeoxyribonuclease V gamma subunit